jgi:hypothetical protein
MNAFRALGFTLAATDTAELRIYDYDLATYKTVPDWPMPFWRTRTLEAN